VSTKKVRNAVLAIVSLIVALVAGYGPQARTQAVGVRVGLAMAAAPRWAIQAHELGIPHLEYTLADGYVHNWLVAGPLATPVEGAAGLMDDAARLRIIRQQREPAPGIAELPVESVAFVVRGRKLWWRYYRALDDHYLDLSDRYPAGDCLQAWAYAQIDVPAAGPVTLILTTDGPADVWLNGQHVHRQEHLHPGDPRSASFQGRLESGPNDVLVRLEQVGTGPTPYAMALRVVTPSGPLDAEVFLPTATADVARRQRLEALLDQAYLEKNVVHKGNDIVMHWEADLNTVGPYWYRILDMRGRTYVEGTPQVTPSEAVNVGHLARLWERDYALALAATPQEYYEHNLRYQRSIPVYVVDNEHATAPYGTYAERRQEALEDAARREGDLYAEVAKSALGRWAEINVEGVIATLAELDADAQDSDRLMVGLLGLLSRYSDAPDFPAELAQVLDAGILDSAYWADDGDHILHATAQILAAQRYADRDLEGRTARSLRRRGERAATSWLRTRADGALGIWETSDDIESCAVALSHLAELAEDGEIRRLSRAHLDGLLLELGRSSYRGVFASARGVDAGPDLISGRLQATSGISRLLWGMGTFNRHTAGTVSLACSTYVPSEVMRAASTASGAETWTCEPDVSEVARGPFWRRPRVTVGRAAYRTPDYMLSSVQSDPPAAQEGQGQVWQATLGPDAIVFTNHPASMDESGARSPGFWNGNGAPPRVMQWKGALVVGYRLPEDDWLGFTHAYWPVYAFDEQTMRGGWAFARAGEGYVALTAMQGLALITGGPGVYRELRSYGHRNTWLCLMGREAIDGSFEAFQDAVLALDIDLGQDGVQLRTLRGEQLSFGWRDALHIDGSWRAVADCRRCECP
jgi:hypothetical protein